MSNNGLNSNSGFLDFSLYNLPETSPEGLNVQGQGQKNIVVIAKEDSAGNEIEFLQSVLSPLGIKYPEDVYILITSGNGVSFYWLCQNYDVDQIVSMGVDPKALGLQINAPSYRPINIAKKRLIFADEIGVFTAEKSKGGPRPKAKQLWVTLKSFFEKS